MSEVQWQLHFSGLVNRSVNIVVYKLLGVYMKDLTFIAEGNPDFFKGGLINLTKRRQVSNLSLPVKF